VAVVVVTVTSTTHGIYTSMYIVNHIHTPLVLDWPHSQRTLRTLMRKCRSASSTYTQLALATCVVTPTAPRDPPSITGLPRRRDVVAVAVAPTGPPFSSPVLSIAVLQRKQPHPQLWDDV